MIMKRMQHIIACKAPYPTVRIFKSAKGRTGIYLASCVVHNEDEKAALDKAKRGR